MREKLSKMVVGSMIAGAALLVATTASDKPKPEKEEDDLDRGGVGNDQRNVGEQDEI